MIKVNAIFKKYGKKEVLKGVDFSIKEGEVFGLLGPNGTGKTTTIKILTGLSIPDSGETFIGGVSVQKEPLEAKKLFRIVTQENTLDRDLSVEENLKIWAMLYGIENANEVIYSLLEKMELASFAKSYPSKLSGGQQRRLMLTRAMMDEPKVLLLDEPSLGLDPQVRRMMWENIREIKSRGTAILLTTHYIEEAENLCDRVGILFDGKIIAQDKPSVLIESLGVWSCVWIDEKNKEHLSHFKEYKDAKIEAEQTQGEVLVRKTTLEDVFLHLTGRGMA